LSPDKKGVDPAINAKSRRFRHLRESAGEATIENSRRILGNASLAPTFARWIDRLA
jgi:hypothetical protein